MLWRIFQALVGFAVLSANIYFQWTPNGYIAAAWAFMAAYAVTVFPFQAYDWWVYRHDRRRAYKAAEAQGLVVGWRRHLPWNAKKPGRVRVDARRSVLNEEERPITRRIQGGDRPRTPSR